MLGNPEPVGAPGAAAGITMALNNLMGRDIDGLNDLADRALLNEHASIDRCFNLKALAVHDAVNASCFSDGFAHLGQLLERSDAGLVGKKVLAMLHGAHAKGCAFIGDL